MPIDPTFHKVFAQVAPHRTMLELINERPDASEQERASGQVWAGRWFEITRQSYDAMFDMMPPRFMKPDMFAVSELKVGTVGSVFFEIWIGDEKRWFHGFCDLSDRDAPHKMRSAILLWESGETAHLTRNQKLDAIWSFTHRDYRGHIPSGANSHGDGPAREGRAILVYIPAFGTVRKRLVDLTDDEIADKLPKRCSQ